MPYIPQEILDIIIGYATADVNGRYLFSAFISHTFHQIVLPYQFKSLTFANKMTRDTIYRTTDIMVIPLFCEAINAGDAHALSLAPLVQELSLRAWSGRHGYANHCAIQGPSEKIMNSVISFRNLTKLNIENCYTSPAVMEQLGKLVQLQSLHTLRCRDEDYEYWDKKVTYGALSNLQSLHTLECEEDFFHSERHFACIPMKKLRILKSGDVEVTKAFLKTDPPVQLKELHLNHSYGDLYSSASFPWNYLASASSLTHLSLPNLQLPANDTSLVPPLQELQYLHIHVAFAPRFANQPMKRMKISTDRRRGEAMGEVRQHWPGTVFPHVEYLDTDRSRNELDTISIEFWREFLPNIKEVR